MTKRKRTARAQIRAALLAVHAVPSSAEEKLNEILISAVVAADAGTLSYDDRLCTRDEFLHFAGLAFNKVRTAFGVPS